MQHDVFFPIGQILERNIRTNAHLPADILHQRPHQRVPRCDGSLVDRQVLVRNQGGLVNSPDSTCAVAFTACPLAVECQILGSRRIEMLSADRTDKIFFGSDPQGWLYIMPVRATVTGQS